MNIDSLLNKSGGVDSKKLKTVQKEQLDELIVETNFLQLEPTVTQRIKAIKFSIKEHPKCPVCNVYLKYAPNKDRLFVEYCSMSCAKKAKSSPKSIEKFKKTIENKKIDNQNHLNNAEIVPKELVIEFFKSNLEVFKNGGSNGIKLLNDNPSMYKSLLNYTKDHVKLNGRIYELLYGGGVCSMCENLTTLYSLERGFAKLCPEHWDTRGLRSVNEAIQKISSFENFNEFKIIFKPRKLNGVFVLHHTKCNSEFELCLNNGRLEDYILHCYNCNNPTISFAELEIQEFLRNNNINYISQYKLESKKLDIFIPKFNLAIEHHGPDHSFGINNNYSRFNNLNNEITEKNIHLERHDLCENNGIRLIHIFDSEWENKQKQKIWQSILSTNFNLNEKVYGRNCIIKLLSDNESQEFLNCNHLQGDCKSIIKLGLYNNEELVSLMTFGKPRFNKNYQWELIRFSNKLNLTVVGGPSKLFFYFRKNYNPANIISYCDKRIFTGSLYEKLGFEFSHNSSPNYWYHKGKQILSRYECQKHKLKNFLKNFDENSTESQNMFNNGYRRMWDCGNKVFIWKK